MDELELAMLKEKMMEYRKEPIEQFLDFFLDSIELENPENRQGIKDNIFKELKEKCNLQPTSTTDEFLVCTEVEPNEILEDIANIKNNGTVSELCNNNEDFLLNEVCTYTKNLIEQYIPDIDDISEEVEYILNRDYDVYGYVEDMASIPDEEGHYFYEVINLEETQCEFQANAGFWGDFDVYIYCGGYAWGNGEVETMNFYGISIYEDIDDFFMNTYIMDILNNPEKEQRTIMEDITERLSRYYIEEKFGEDKESIKEISKDYWDICSMDELDSTLQEEYEIEIKEAVNPNFREDIEKELEKGCITAERIWEIKLIS